MASPSLSSSPSVSHGRAVIVAALLAAAVALFVDLDVDSLARFVRWYSTRFVDYYTRKFAVVQTTLRRVEQYLPELPDDLYEAWDFTAALLVVVAIFHLIERLRIALLAKVR